jgi:hypothetical protein
MTRVGPQRHGGWDRRMLDVTDGVLQVAGVQISEGQRRWTGNMTGGSTGETETAREY